MQGTEAQTTQSRSKIYIYSCVLITGLVFLIIYMIASDGSTNSSNELMDQLPGIWSINDDDRAIFGLKDYVLYIGQKKGNELQSYLLVSNDKCILYDDIVDLVHIEGQSQQFRAISYGSPIVPLVIFMHIDSKKNTLEIKDKDVLLTRLQKLSDSPK